jgi:aspartyl-tRNA(Asn)/glutamyl-tRNA(Gln) amidotransferase subunit A
VRELTRLSISEASDLLRRRFVSSVELTDATLRRIEATDPVVHAYVTVLSERARRSAYHAES